jgi:hypothetical protein
LISSTCEWGHLYAYCSRSLYLLTRVQFTSNLSIIVQLFFIMRHAFLSVILLFFVTQSFADSPLTSIDFKKAYQDVEIVKLAATKQGILTEDLMGFLIDNTQQIQFKIALINELGWDINGKKNAGLLISYLLQKKLFATEEAILENADGDLLICIAYLKAMDNYFNVHDALAWAKKAKQKADKSYTVQMIGAIIEAQIYLGSNWCKVYKTVRKVERRKGVKRDMDAKAADLIFIYIDGYKKCCGCRLFKKSRCVL